MEKPKPPSDVPATADPADPEDPKDEAAEAASTKAEGASMKAEPQPLNSVIDVLAAAAAQFGINGAEVKRVLTDAVSQASGVLSAARDKLEAEAAQRAADNAKPAGDSASQAVGTTTQAGNNALHIADAQPGANVDKQATVDAKQAADEVERMIDLFAETTSGVAAVLAPYREKILDLFRSANSEQAADNGVRLVVNFTKSPEAEKESTAKKLMAELEQVLKPAVRGGRDAASDEARREEIKAAVKTRLEKMFRAPPDKDKLN